MLCCPKRGHSERGIIPMKNSDMKVIAIILSIALFFTIVTSNAVSVVSVITLLKDGGTTQQAPVEGGDVATNQGAQSNQGGTQSSNTQQPVQNNTQSNNTQSNNTQSNTGDVNANSNDAVIADPFAFYSKAANEIHTNGTAGYKKIGWQAVEGQLTLDKLAFLAGTLTDLIAGFMTEKDAAEVKDCPKGSDDAKSRMPASNCSKQYIKSATAVKEGDNYVITIVLTEFVNPSYADADGLQLMSREFLDYKDVEKTVVEDPTVSKVVKSLDGTITYTDYTITATMTSDGKFIKIVHYGVGNIVASVQAVAGSLNASGALSFNAEYYDFVY